MRRVLDYHCERGEVFERLVLIKDRRTHRRRVPVQALAAVLVGGVKYILPTVVTTEGGVMIQLTPNQTEWLGSLSDPETSVGPLHWDAAYRWDMEVLISRSALLTSTPLMETVAVGGLLTVKTYDNIAPLSSDTISTALIPLLASL